jgi:solute:Na+ symporter, SSS family
VTGCAVAQIMGTTVPYAVYGIAASAVVLLAIGLTGERVTATELAYGKESL